MESLVEPPVTWCYNGLFACSVPHFQCHIVDWRLFDDATRGRNLTFLTACHYEKEKKWPLSYF